MKISLPPSPKTAGRWLGNQHKDNSRPDKTASALEIEALLEKVARALGNIDVEYVNTPNTSQYVGPAQTRMIHVFNTCIAVTIRHDDCSSIIYGTSESFVTVVKEPSYP